MISPNKLPKDWQKKIGSEFESSYMKDLNSFLNLEINSGKKIFPLENDIFTAFNLTPFKKVKAVIIGQDPYHNDGQAHGLSFSVKKGIKTPPSLKNMYKELHDDIGMEIPDHGFLEGWAKQGVLLLNSVLTVEAHQAGSHKKKGWEKFTDKVVQVLNDECENLVFLLWGSHAIKKGSTIDSSKHCVLTGPHPSPLSAYRGFFGCKHFSQANKYLNSKNLEPIDWSLL